MAERWQQWMPFHIDKFRGSPEVQAMHPAARIGYLYLLASAWQSGDCTVSADALDLATESGLGDEMWAAHGPRILRKFTAQGTRLTNVVLLAEWREARAVWRAGEEGRQATHELLSEAGRKGAAKRWGSDGVGHKQAIHTPHKKHSQDMASDGLTGTTTGTTTNPPTPLPTVHDLATMVAKRLQVETSLKSPKLFLILQPVALAELQTGIPHESVFEAMAGAWNDFQAAKPQLQFHWGAEAFFGEGNWKNKAGWPWKETHGSHGSRFDSKTKQSLDAASLAIADALAGTAEGGDDPAAGEVGRAAPGEARARRLLGPGG